MTERIRQLLEIVFDLADFRVGARRVIISSTTL